MHLEVVAMFVCYYFKCDDPPALCNEINKIVLHRCVLTHLLTPVVRPCPANYRPLRDRLRGFDLIKRPSVDRALTEKMPANSQV